MAGQPLRHLDPACVRGHHHEVRQPELGLEVVLQQRQRGEVVERNVEEPLDLSAVQVHRHDPVGAGGGQ